jgi:hypothetical protein
LSAAQAEASNLQAVQDFKVSRDDATNVREARIIGGVLNDAVESQAVNGHANSTTLKGKGKAREEYETSAALWIQVAAPTSKRRSSVDLVQVQINDSLIDVSPPIAITIILFDPPNPSSLRFLTLEPLDLNEIPALEDVYETEAYQLGVKLEQLLAARPHRWFEITGGFKDDHGPGGGFRTAIRLMNAAYQCRARFQRSEQTPGNSRIKMQIKSSFSVAFSALILCCRFARGLLHRPLIRGTSLVQVSHAAAQLSLRLEQISSFPTLAAGLRRLRKDDHVPISFLAARYITVWNGLWLIANDLILGWAVGLTLRDHHSTLGRGLAEGLKYYSLEPTIAGLRWLDDWPGGLKLNTELSAFYLDMYLGLFYFFRSLVVDPILSVLPTLLAGIGLAGSLLGLSILICLVSDLLRLLCLHLSALHWIARSQYRLLLHLLSFLLLLFRGKKRNILKDGPSPATRARSVKTRRNTSPADYDFDQLLLGTILFTLFLFLSPTIFVYHALFALAVSIVEVTTQGLMVEVLVQRGMNKLPLFALMLRCKDPRRVPAGIWLEEVKSDVNGKTRGFVTTRYRLISQPLSFWTVMTANPPSYSQDEQSNYGTSFGSSESGKGTGLSSAVIGLFKAVLTGEEVRWR